MESVLEQINHSLTKAVESAQHGLVQISNGGRGFGAGTIWHPDGLIITNAHVVAGHHGLKVSLPDGRTLPADVLAADSERDVAALAVDAHDLPCIELGNSKRLRAGDWVIAVGHPWGVQGAVTSGIVIGMGANLPDVPRAQHEWIVVDLHMRPGHSGGPLVDVDGRLVGINTMIAGPDVGFAIPVHAVKVFLKQSLHP